MLQNIFRLVDIENTQIEFLEDTVITDDVQRHTLERLVLDELELELDSSGLVGRHLDGTGDNLHAQL
jgi:hypothetical protein